MKRYWYISIIIIGLVVAIKGLDIRAIKAVNKAKKGAVVPLEVDVSDVVLTNADRIGINLGRWGSWGAEQLGKNVILNPGFEGEISRIIVFVNRSDVKSFSDDRDQNYLDGMWEGAEWEVRTGNSKGAKGIVTQSLRLGVDGLPQYFSESVPSLEKGDTIVLTKLSKGDISRYWYVNPVMKKKISFDTDEFRPGSPGSQSLLLSPRKGESTELSYFMDHITKRSGKLIKIEGKWKLSVWLKAKDEGRFSISLVRLGSPIMLKEEIIPTNDWQEYTFEFEGKDTGNPDLIELKITAFNAPIWVDDITLEPVQPENHTAFRQEVIESLEMIRPSFLRTLANFGDTFENRTANAFARKYILRRTNGNVNGEGGFDFSYGEILDLCEKVNANPWLVIPTTFSEEDYSKVGEFLHHHAKKNRFSEVIVEFGNENWNYMFRPQAFPSDYIQQHGIIAAKAFDLIKKASEEDVNLRFVVNGQHSWPTLSTKYYDSVSNVDSYSPGAYFMDRLDDNTSDSQALEMLFAGDPGLLEEHMDAIKERGKSGTIYEFNLHTTSGSASEDQRDRAVAGMASGVALGKRALYLMGLGFNPVIAFSLTQYDIKAWEADGYAKLFGVTRDFGPPVRYRPTGLAIAMLNRTIGGDMYGVKPIGQSVSAGEKLTTSTFKTPKMWTAAVVSENSSGQIVALQFPDDGHPIPETYAVLESNSPFDTNETAENVKIVEKNLEVSDRIVKFTVPAWGLAVLGSSDDFSEFYSAISKGEQDQSIAAFSSTMEEPVVNEIRSDDSTLNKLKNRVREVENKQEEILRDLQNLIDILGEYTQKN